MAEVKKENWFKRTLSGICRYFRELKSELTRKLADFSSPTDTMEETFENREQIEISRYYERLPKPTIIATEEFLDDELFYKEGK